jgi:glycosyltransferase involved in cell wall biosynthesis
MRIAVDAHAIGRHLTGNEVYIRSLLNAIANLDRKSEFLAYVTGPEGEAGIPRRFETRQIAANPFIRLGFDLSHKLRSDRPDLLHVQYTSPLCCPVPTVVTVHDVSFLERPEYFTASRALQLRTTVARSVKRAARVLTVSEFARESIVRAYNLPPEKIVVTPDAASPSFRAISRTAATYKVRERFHVSGPYVLAVGDLQPRKNHIGLIHAFARLMKDQPQLPHDLVLAGKDTWFGRRVREAARQSGMGGRIHFTGFVSDDDLLQLYNACDCFAFPSFYEGFGIPVLEAMACGRPVICSNSSAIPEVADGAALLFNPARTEEIVQALADVLRNGELRTRMERLGLKRASYFSWQKTAEMTLQVYREVAGAKMAPLKTARESAARVAAGGRR